jgi:hypothetical protein
LDVRAATGQSDAVKLSRCFGLALAWAWAFWVPDGRAAVDAAGQEAAGIVAGIQKESGARLVYNEKTLRLEVRDDLGSLLEEFPAGAVSRTVDVAGQEYRLSFGKDEAGRPSVIVRPGPAMQKPLLVEVFGRKAVLSPNASLLATLAEDRQVFYEPSICGEVYYIEDFGGPGSKVSRLATTRREVAVLAKPSNPTGAGPGALRTSQDDGKEMEKAGDAFKSAMFAVLGLPDKQPSGKAKVYRLRSSGSEEEPAQVAAPVSAEAGRP